MGKDTKSKTCVICGTKDSMKYRDDLIFIFDGQFYAKVTDLSGYRCEKCGAATYGPESLDKIEKVTSKEIDKIREQEQEQLPAALK